jgi:hypothetical protein
VPVPALAPVWYASVKLGSGGGRSECGLRRNSSNSASVVLSAWVLLQLSRAFLLFIDVFKGYFSGECFLKCLAFACLFCVDNNRLNSEWKGVDVERNQKAGREGCNAAMEFN